MPSVETTKRVELDPAPATMNFSTNVPPPMLFEYATSNELLNGINPAAFKLASAGKLRTQVPAAPVGELSTREPNAEPPNNQYLSPLLLPAKINLPAANDGSIVVQRMPSVVERNAAPGVTK